MDPDGGWLSVGGAAGVEARVVHLCVLQRETADRRAVVIAPDAHFHLLHLVVGDLLKGVKGIRRDRGKGRKRDEKRALGWRVLWKGREKDDGKETFVERNNI